MPVVLSQIFLAGERVYEDSEGVLYHYPRQYFTRIVPYDRFVYYRPLGKTTRRSDSLHYFGHGVLGDVTPDPRRPGHRFVDIAKFEPFEHIVPLRDPRGLYYETGTTENPQMQSAVRRVSDIAYHRILAAAEMSETGVSLMPSTAEVTAGMFVGRSPTFKDRLRELREVPPGAGYVPTGSPVDVYESAALQERARADHQSVLAAITIRIRKLGGATWYNNNIDLYATLGEQRMLIEAKSLNDPRRAVDRMRYGMGQLFDYRARYAEEVDGAIPVLAFGRPPPENAGLSCILDANGVALVSQDRERLFAMNNRAEALPFLDAKMNC
jgi:hypothetical protein